MTMIQQLNNGLLAMVCDPPIKHCPLDLTRGARAGYLF